MFYRFISYKKSLIKLFREKFDLNLFVKKIQTHFANDNNPVNAKRRVYDCFSNVGKEVKRANEPLAVEKRVTL